MKKMLLIFFITALSFIACNDHGTKISINNQSEVYYKGDGVTEDDAKKLGSFLLKQGYFTTTDTRSVQLLKNDDTYIVKFVVDENKLNKDRKNVLFGFKIWHMWIKDNVFNGAKTRIVLANNNLEDLQLVEEFTAMEKEQLTKPQVDAGNTIITDKYSNAADSAATDRNEKEQ